MEQPKSFTADPDFHPRFNAAFNLLLKLQANLYWMDFDNEIIGVLNEIRVHSSKFYNMVLYELREGNLLEQNEFYNLFKDHFRTGYLQAHTYVNAIKMAMKDMKSYFISDLARMALGEQLDY